MHANIIQSHRIEYEPPYYIVARLYTTVSRRSMHRVYKSIGNKFVSDTTCDFVIYCLFINDINYK